eukprot:TRINITY_DN2928_c2_g1::TRINITY_DN2928_c2_g1_i1::g.4220::m.4220 TRINITY_DN2928_c2_g1::TRINITY_DN2928_c2_g1_i1::g.4220  ORF type:complete len:357 (+),score=50.14,sp/Q642M9/DHDH_DANRE/38.42/1e-76,GFO_IDH_MocA/PF01408.17/2.9e-29,GFO_IDH_MocA_C/PF02894.12/0.00066,F420_oxidored/PF03807.12/0.0016,Semialdhyde_dh/PF01118.19/0.025,NAD_binding_3/PF03447.11/0.077 TRINITY_DN2928_c2_g1_i1:46-1071(+)
MASQLIRWGIVGTGRIAHDFVTALQVSKNGHAHSVASRSLTSAQTFATAHNIPNAFGSYEELIQSPEVDVMYIATPQHLHKDLCLQCIAANKNILCEKPMTLNLQEAKEVIDAAKKQGVFFMEGNWMLCMPLIRRIFELIDQNTIGEVTHIFTDFGWKNDFQANPSIGDPATGGGSLLALGVYTFGLPLAIYDQLPSKLKAVGSMSEGGVDLQTTTSMQFGPNQLATVSSSIISNLPGHAVICGTKGQIRIPFPFLCPTKLVVHHTGSSDNTVEECPMPKNSGTFNFINSSGLLYEAEEVHRCLRVGLKESPFVSHEFSLRCMEVQDQIRKEVGLKFPSEL